MQHRTAASAAVRVRYRAQHVARSAPQEGPSRAARRALTLPTSRVVRSAHTSHVWKHANPEMQVITQ
jgi:hypothetical protein